MTLGFPLRDNFDAFAPRELARSTKDAAQPRLLIKKLPATLAAIKSRLSKNVEIDLWWADEGRIGQKNKITDGHAKGEGTRHHSINARCGRTCSKPLPQEEHVENVWHFMRDRPSGF
ncbi:hypothetical protein [Ensifer sp. YR511]|uniref:hypothetical protein n=1 Tax=Ensifer sp. YR511 TaxID=1855294 RepID=UPI000888112E|nr:hypothetical protein [Ensifer sp. YR511]SDO10952.1 hypothetical protein SAMN05216328_1552 [Ensifer sp. YR511]